MKKRIFESIPILFVFFFTLLVTSSVSAHGSEPRLEISAERLSPGEALQIRGVDFEYDQEVTTDLIGSQVEISLGSLIADAEGVFIQNILLPDSLAEGIYAVRASTDDHVVMSPPIKIWGAAITNQEDTGIRDQSDLQLGLMPTFTADEATRPSMPINELPAVATVSAPLASRPVEEGSPASGLWIHLLVSAALMLVGIVVVFGILRKRLR